MEFEKAAARGMQVEKTGLDIGAESDSHLHLEEGYFSPRTSCMS